MKAAGPLALSGSSEIAAQFDHFTRQELDLAEESEPATPAVKKGRFGFDRIASMW